MSGADVCVAIVRIGHQAFAQLAEKAAESAASFCSASSSSPNGKQPLQKSTPPFFGPADFDLLMSVPPPPLLAPGPSCSSRVQIEHQALALPKCRTQRGERAVDAALRFVAELDSQLLTRAINIPLAMKAADFSQEPSCSASPPSPLLSAEEQPQLVLIPVTHAQAPESSRCGPQGLLEFCPFATVLHAAMNYDCSLVDAQSQDLLVRLGDWLSQGQCRSGPTFVHSLFLVPAAGNASRRILRQNSAMEQQMESNGSGSKQQQQQEVRVAGGGGGGGNRYLSSLPSLDKENGSTQTSQQPSGPLRAELALESTPPPPPKHSCYTRFVVNPLFGTDFLPSRRRAMAPDYFVRGRPCRDFPNKRRRRSSGGGAGVQHQRSPTEFWEQQYPLHKHAFDGNAQKIRHLLSLGYDPNELDNDFWTPLHYCAFYNRLDACQALLLHPRTDVNVPNRTGASPLHFAALNGHVYVAELLLSHQLADINLRDSTGKTPLDLCAPVPKPDWQGVAFLLQQQNAAVLRPSKLEVQLLGGSVLQVEVDDPETATAGELREKVLRMEGLEPDALNTQIFAIWLVDSRLSLQLKAEQKVQVHLDKWAEHLEKFGGEAAENSGGAEDDGNGVTTAEADRVRVVLKRDARALLADEQMLARKSPVAVSLLYGEAEAQFLRGMFPCHEKHFLPMAAIIGHRLYGAEWPRTVDAQFLGRILPRHLVPSATAEFRAFASLVSKLRQAHRQLLGLNLVQLQLRFLGLCWSLNVYGCTFFRAYMLMAKPLRGNLQVHVGLNDWGMSLLNVATQRQVAAIELDKLEAKFTPGSHFLEVQSRKRDFVATITTPQAQLINNLLKQIRLKVQSAKAGSGGGGGGK